MHGLVYTNVRLQPHPSFIWSSAGGLGYSSTDTAMQDSLRELITAYFGTSFPQPRAAGAAHEASFTGAAAIANSRP